MMAFVTFIFAFIAVLVLPGMLLFLNIFRWDRKYHFFDILPESFIFSFSIGLVPGFYVLFCHKNLNTFIGIYLLFYLLILLLNHRAIRNNLSAFLKSDTTDKPPRAVWEITIMILGVLVMVVGAFSFRWGMSSDSWYTCANVRHFLISDAIYAQNPMFVDSTFINTRSLYDVYGLFCATLSYISRADVFSLVFLYIKIPLVLLAVLSLYSFASELFNKKIASLTIPVLAFFCLLTAYTQEGTGYILFGRISQDKTIMAFVCLPMVLKYMYRYIRAEGKKDLLCFSVCALVTIILHPQGIIFIVFAWSCYLLSRLLPGCNVAGVRRFFILMIPVVIFSGFPFYQRAEYRKAPAEIARFSYSLQELKRLYSFKLPDGTLPCVLRPGGQALPRERYIKPLKKGFYITSPALINNGFYITTLLIAFGWLSDRKKAGDDKYRFLVGLALIGPLVIFNPVTAPVFGYFTTSFKMWRMIWLIPVPLVIAVFIHDQPKRIPKLNWNVPAVLLLPVIVAFSIGYEYTVLGKTHFHRRMFNNYRFFKSRYHSYYSTWKNIDEIVFHINDRAKTKWLLAPRHVNTRIPAYYGNIGILDFKGYVQTYYSLHKDYSAQLIQQRENIVRQYSKSELSIKDFTEAVTDYNIDTIVIEKQSAEKYLAASVRLGFEQTYENNLYIIVKKLS